jgi:hypothetical protein
MTGAVEITGETTITGAVSVVGSVSLNGGANGGVPKGGAGHEFKQAKGRLC